MAMAGLAFFFGAPKLIDRVVQMCTLTVALCAFIGWHRSVGKRGKAVLPAVLAVLAVVSFCGPTADHLKNFGRRSQMNTWVVYHHFLGAKYFDELGYTGLYEQTLAVDAATGRRLTKIKKIRNLRTYQHEKVFGTDRFKRSELFSDKRWEEFKNDVNYFAKYKGMGFWKRVLRDRGYNCSPTWNFFASSLFSLFSIQNQVSQTFLILLDVFFVLLAFGVSVRAYGWARSLLVLSSFYLWFGNSHDFGGIYLLDWFAAVWAGVSAWRLGWMRTSGALFAYAAMVRVFPAAFFLGPIVHAALRLIRTRRIEQRYRRFFAQHPGAGLQFQPSFQYAGPHPLQRPHSSDERQYLCAHGQQF